jgi:short-subunit dehydrogenase
MKRSHIFALAAAGSALGIRRMLSMKWLRNQVVLITGGSRGLGLLLAREAARQGAKLAICARDATELLRAQEELAHQTEVLAIGADVSDELQARALVDETLTRYGRIDVLINCAGMIQVAPMEALRLADYRAAMETNFFGVLHTSLAVLPHFRARRAGRIVNICSVGGAIAVPHLLPYSASKFAAVGFSQGLTEEVAHDGISVTTVLPGVMRTGSHVNIQASSEREFAWFSVAASVPGISSSAERAARKILREAGYGRRVTHIGMSARLAHAAQGLAPNLVVRALTLVSELLPFAPEQVPAWLTALGDRQSLLNNELTWAAARSDRR